MSCNIIKEYVDFSKGCLKKYSKLIMDKEFDQDIFDQFCHVYIDARFYNNSKNFRKGLDYNVGYALRELFETLKEDHDMKKIGETFKMFKFLLYFDTVRECDSIRDVLSDLTKFRENDLKLKTNDKFEDEIFDIIRDDLIHKKEFIDKFHSDNFKIEFYLTNIKNVYDSVLESQLKFPRLYNLKSIKKIFDSKEIFEDRLYVEYSYVATQVLLDVIKGDFDREYLVNFAPEVTDKKNNLKRLLNIIDNDVAKEKIVIKLHYSDFMKDKESYYVNMRLGFKYAVIVDEGFVYTENNLKFLSIFKYVIISSKAIYFEEISKQSNVIVLR